jgi:hypothetical protein
MYYSAINNWLGDLGLKLGRSLGHFTNQRQRTKSGVAGVDGVVYPACCSTPTTPPTPTVKPWAMA